MTSPTNSFSDLTVVSPMRDGDEEKDQDRAVWFPVMQAACLADGTSSSPYSAEAADHVCRFSPTLFMGNGTMTSRLKTIADLLIALRLEAQKKRLKALPNVSESMQAMLHDIARDTLAQSYQTTMIAASFVLADQTVIARVVHIGDSAFFAFDGDGELLTTTLSNRQSGTKAQVRPKGAMRFEPGDLLLVKNNGSLAARPELLQRAGIELGHADKWLVCAPIDRCGANNEHGNDNEACWLTQDDRLLVPRYLAEKPADLRLEEFCTIRYSRMIRRVGSPATKVRLGGKGVVTMVLPDHVGSCKSFEDRFPADAHFLLASDGFYEGFSRPHEMWHWLVSHESALRDRQQRGVLLQQLHQQLQTTRGDDDISFIWLKTHGSSMNKEQINAG